MKSALTTAAKECAIVANFTADPLLKSLNFLLRELDLPVLPRLEPYDQVMQFLYSNSSGTKPADFAVLLVQVERWLELETQQGQEEFQRKLADFCDAAVMTAKSSGTYILIFLCPTAVLRKKDFDSVAGESEIKARLSAQDGIEVIDRQEIEKLYPGEHNQSEFDPYTEAIAKIPYSRSYFARLGMIITRRLYKWLSPPRKVIVVDCDNTLWSGIVGEVGHLNIVIDAGRRKLQEFLLEQASYGRLVCLCSKNNLEDVFEVFKKNKSMVLRETHLTAWKINWEAKPDNLRALSEELSLGLDAFVFIDDDAFECSLMRRVYPQVLTVQLPPEPAQIEAVLTGIWDLDRVNVTAEDVNRRAYYRQSAERTRFQQQAPSLADFIASLQLVVQMSRLTLSELARAVQLTERTNQFNLNGRRQTAAELTQLLGREGCTCASIRASDRFGDYGQAGLLICHARSEVLRVETLVLSCRAIGKGIDTHIAANIADIAEDSGLAQIEFDYQPTPKNHAFRSFLKDFGVIESQGRWCVAPDRLRRLALPK